MGFFKIRQVFFQRREEGLSKRRVGPGFISKEEGKQRYFGGMVGGGIVLEFSGGKKISPRLGIVGAKDPKVGFDFLVGAFGLSVSLGVVSSGKADVIMEESGEFPGKGRSELRSSIRDQGVVETETFEHMIEKE